MGQARRHIRSHTRNAQEAHGYQMSKRKTGKPYQESRARREALLKAKLFLKKSEPFDSTFAAIGTKALIIFTVGF